MSLRNATIGIPVKKVWKIDDRVRPIYFDSENSDVKFRAFQACQHAIANALKLIRIRGTRNATVFSDRQKPYVAITLFQ